MYDLIKSFRGGFMRRYFLWFIMFLLTTIVFSCGGSKGNNEPMVNGIVTDGQNYSPLAGVAVSISLPGSSISLFSTTTDSQGSFSIPMKMLTVGTPYALTFVLQYYDIETVTYSSNAGLFLPVSIVALPQPSKINGTVRNAATNLGLPGIKINIRTGLNNYTSSKIEKTVHTNPFGLYSTRLFKGTYTAEVADGIGSQSIIQSYFTLISILGESADNNKQDLPVTEPLALNQYRIVLKWGNNPNDLDCHLTGPADTAESRFHLYFYGTAIGQKFDFPAGTSSTDASGGFRTPGSTTEALLNLKDSNNHGIENGPETATIVKSKPGRYNYYVHHYNGQSTISLSRAEVHLYKGSTLLRRFIPPQSQLGFNADWSVFSMEVTSGGETITPVNTISMITGALPKLTISKVDEHFLFSNLPRK